MSAITSTYGKHTVEMDEAQLAKVLDILRRNNMPTNGEALLLSYVTYQSVYWSSILSDMLKDWKKRIPHAFPEGFDPDIFNDDDTIKG